MDRVWGVALVAIAAGVAACAEKKTLDEEIQDVVEEQTEAAEQAAENPRDTAEIRRQAEDVIEEQRDVQKALPEEMARQNVPRVIPSTTTSQ